MTDNAATATVRRGITVSRMLPVLCFAALAWWIKPARALDNNLQIRGTLVSEPCVLDPDGNTITVDFGTVIEKGLYNDIRSAAVPFNVTLTECDASLGQSVNLILSGAESAALPGMLTVTGAGGSGVVIGVETQQAQPVPINKPTPAYAINNGTVTIPLQAYLQITPDALQNHTLAPGQFAAALTVDVSYP